MIEALLILVIVVIGYVLYLGMKEKKSQNMAYTFKFLHVLISKKESDIDEKKDAQGSGGTFKDKIGLMEQLLSSLHDIGKDKHISFEYATKGGLVHFYVGVPESAIDLVEKQITSYYPDAIVELEDEYVPFTEGFKEEVGVFEYKKEYKYPFKTYQALESDPINNIINSVSKLGDGENAIIQILCKPVADTKWQEKAKKLAEDLYNGKKQSKFNIWKFLKEIFSLKSEKKDENKEPKRLTPLTEEVVKSIETKSQKVGYDVIIRIVTSARAEFEAKNIMANISGGFVQYAHPRMNSIVKSKKKWKKGQLMFDLLLRKFDRGRFEKQMIMSTEEIASIFHFPFAKYNNLGSIKWQNYKISPPPDNLPEEGLLLGHTNYRGVKKELKIKNEDRFRHFYIIGQTGTGKSTILQTMIRQDFRMGHGCCVMDPHGELAEAVLPFIPRSRADDVIIINPADTERPLGLNMLEADTDEEKERVALDAMSMMIGMFGHEIFGPRIQDYFRNGCLTLMSDPEGGTLTDIVNLFTNAEFQKKKRKHITNPIVKSWWDHTYDSMADREKQEIIPYLAAKFGQFITNSTMRNIIGQTKSSFDFFDAMQEGKIILVNLSKGLIGDVNAKLLGMIIVNKIQLAAMRRQKLAPADRKDFFFYIDEFQNFVTESIESILSEARKYRLGLILAHQYIDQLESKSLAGETKLKGAIFGNVGNIMSLKIGEVDAEFMAKVFAPVFSELDIANQDNFKAIMKLSIDLTPSKPFSFTIQKAWEMAGYNKDMDAAEAMTQLSRLKYGRAKEFVDKEIVYRLGA